MVRYLHAQKITWSDVYEDTKDLEQAVLEDDRFIEVEEKIAVYFDAIEQAEELIGKAIDIFQKAGLYPYQKVEGLETLKNKLISLANETARVDVTEGLNVVEGNVRALETMQQSLRNLAGLQSFYKDLLDMVV